MTAILVGPGGGGGGSGCCPPTDPQHVVFVEANLVAGGVVDFDSPDVPAGKTGLLSQVVFAASVPLRADIKTVVAGVETVVDVVYRYLGDLWRPPQPDYVPLAGAAGSFFRVTVTNLDTTQAADVHGATYWDEV